MTTDPRPVALVTGVSSGIGHAVARDLLAHGWAVAGLSRGAPAGLDLDWVRCDLGSAADLDRAIGEIRGAHPQLTAIVHAAGLQRTARLGELDHGAGHQMWRVHVGAAEQLVDGLLDRVRDGGRIVLVGSRTMAGVPGKSQYAATKAALPALARAWGAELAGRSVTVNVVAPGPTDTPMLTDPGRVATPPVAPPLGRLVRPDEVATLVRYLLEPTGEMITGQTLVICAGASLPA